MSQQHILIVEDDISMQHILEGYLGDEGYSCSIARNGVYGLAELAERLPDLILLDLVMPEMDGWTFFKKLKQSNVAAEIPVILLTSMDSPESFERGLAEGAYHYVIKPVDPLRLGAMIRSTLNERDRVVQLKMELKETNNLLAKTEEWKVSFRTIEEAVSLSKIIARVSPEPERLVTGLCELLINAVEHGIAQISYEEKGTLQLEDRWAEEVRQRLLREENISKSAVLRFTRIEDEISLIIQDPGDGFIWEDYIEFSEERMTDLHGRGVAFAKAFCFDSLVYSGCGNMVKVGFQGIDQSETNNTSVRH